MVEIDPEKDILCQGVSSSTPTNKNNQKLSNKEPIGNLDGPSSLSNFHKRDKMSKKSGNLQDFYNNLYVFLNLPFI